MRLGLLSKRSFRENFYFWTFISAISSSAIGYILGFNLSNGPVFLIYIAAITAVTKGRCLRVIYKPSYPLALAILFFLLSAASLYLQNINTGAVYDSTGQEAYQHAITNLAVCFLYFFMGCVTTLPSRTLLGNHGLLASTSLLIIVIAAGGGVLDYSQITRNNNEFEVTQIDLSQPIAVATLLATCFSRKFKFVVAAIGCLTLFLLGSRTAFFIGTATLSGFLAIQGGIKGRNLFLIFTSISMVALAPFLLEIKNPLVERMILSGGLEFDSSYLSRQRQMEIGLLQLKNQILLGDYSFVVNEFGSIGFYIHNITGYWQQYGLVVFLALLILIFSFSKNIFSGGIKKKLNESPEISFSMLLWVYANLSLLISMSYTFKIFWLAVGINVMVAAKFRGDQTGKPAAPVKYS